VLPADERALEIAKTAEGQRYDVMERSDGSVTVMPWPFQEDQFTVNVEACYLEQLKFDSNDELTEALQTALIKTLEWSFVK